MPSSPSEQIAALKTPKTVQNANVVTDPVRWAILERLAPPQTVRQLSDGLNLKPGVVAYHLKRLMELDVVEQMPNPDRKNGVMFQRKSYEARINVTPTELGVHEGA